MTQLTELFSRLQSGEAGVRDALFAAAYSELHRLAKARLRDSGPHTVLDNRTGARILPKVRSCRGPSCRRPTRVLRLRLAGDAVGHPQQRAGADRLEAQR